MYIVKTTILGETATLVCTDSWTTASLAALEAASRFELVTIRNNYSDMTFFVNNGPDGFHIQRWGA